LKINKKIIAAISIITLVISAILYNILYTNNKKNEIFNEFDFEEENNIESVDEREETKTIFIDIGGEVINPGIYEIKENARVNDAIIAAGGTTNKADLTEINLAYVLSDALKITIPKKEEGQKENSKKNTSISSSLMTSKADVSQVSGLININTATKNQLKNLEGIGDSTAQKIIDYRTQNGQFNKTEDIKNVSGIGESKYQKIKDKISI
jgi:competence protein ComEA